MTITKQALLELLGDRPVAYHPILAKALGGVVEAVFISQLLYWTGKGKLADRWIYKTQAEMEEETGLTRSNQETARRNLQKLGVMEEARRGVPGRMHYRLDLDRLAELLTLQGSHNVDSPQCEKGEPDNVDCGDSADYNGETPQSIPETTTDDPETTEQGAPAPPARADTRDPTDLPEAEAQEALLFSGRRPGISDPKQDRESHARYNDAFVEIYYEVTGLHPRTKQQRPAIEALGLEPNPDEQLWEAVIRNGLLCGWSPTNITWMLDHYRRRELPRTGGNGGKHGPNQRTGAATGRPGYHVADPPDHAESERIKAEIHAGGARDGPEGAGGVP